MELLVVNQTKHLIGAHATTGLINDYVNARLANYGSGVRHLEVKLLYPPKRLTSLPTDSFDKEFRRLATLCPRVTFFRAKRRIEIRFVCRSVSPRSIEGPGHLTPDEAGHLAESVIEALELLRPRFQPADRFDVEKFLSDSQAALVRCPAAIRRWLL